MFSQEIWWVKGNLERSDELLYVVQLWASGLCVSFLIGVLHVQKELWTVP